jgi:hypothetical protein
MVGAAGIGASDYIGGGSGDANVAAACDRPWGALQAAAFIADGNQRRIFGSGSFKALPGSVGGTAIDDDDLCRSESLPHQALNQRVDVIAFIENGGGHAHGCHVESNQCTRENQLPVASSQLSVKLGAGYNWQLATALLILPEPHIRAVDSDPAFFVICGYTGKEVVG